MNNNNDDDDGMKREHESTQKTNCTHVRAPENVKNNTVFVDEMCYGYHTK